MTNAVLGISGGSGGSSDPNLLAHPSPSIWKDFPADLVDQSAGNVRGLHIYERWKGFSNTVAANVGTIRTAEGGYKSFEDTSTSLAISNTDVAAGPVIVATTTSSDNDEVAVEYNNGVAGFMAYTDGSGPRFWFETRVKWTTVGNTHNSFIGLAEKGLAATDGLFSDSNAIGDKSLLGFHVLAADGDALLIGSQKNGGSGTQSATLHDGSSSYALTAATWVKLGITGNQNDPQGRPIRFYVNGTEVGYLASSGAKFPSGSVLNFLMNVKNSTTTSNVLSCNWWRFGTVYV